MKETIVTAGDGHYPCFDRNGHVICVGDRIRFQHCVGPYGQTKIDETTVIREHYEYGSIGRATLHYDATTQTMRGFHTHQDVEHGHETWIEVIASQGRDS